jgi:pyruvate ferredoxin oxidoreductase beta subunit
MSDLNVYAAKLLPKEELFAPGHRACQGCVPALALRMIMKVLGRNTIVANATGCMEIVSSSYPDTAWEVPWMHVAFENAAAVAAGIEAGIKVLQRKGKYPVKERITILGVAGDGGTSDIGIQALSGALERGHRMIFLCYDNEAYMNTGIQRSSTTTSPAGKASKGQGTWKKPLVQIAAAHQIPYVATMSPGYPFDLIEKVKKAMTMEGPVFLHTLVPCPTGWRSESDIGIRLSRLVVQTGMYPLYEVENGRTRVTVRPPFLKPLKEYTSVQGRFRHLKDEDLKVLEERIHREYNELLARSEPEKAK